MLGPLRTILNPSSEDDARQLYLDLMKRCLTRVAFEDGRLGPEPGDGALQPFRRDLREEGRDWPAAAETMIGLHRLDNLEACVRDVIRRRVRGDLIETGVWRGGAVIFMRAILEAYGERGRTVWVADSFQGLPQPDPARYPADTGDTLWTHGELAVSLEEVEVNFRRYGLLDEQVRFLPGWFRDTLPSAPIESLAVLRLDGDLYESTIVALEALYDRVSKGGFVIVDDYALETCRAAVDDFRAARSVGEPLERIDWTGVYWRKA